MKYLLLITLQTNYEDWGIKSILIGAIIALASVVVYLYKSKEKTVSDKDAKILEVIKEHQLDLKENNKDYERLVDRYHEFTQQIKELITYGKQ